MAVVLSLLVLLTIALLLGAFALWRKGGERRQVFLMLLLAAVVGANVAIWTVPDAVGEAPIDRTPR